MNFKIVILLIALLFSACYAVDVSCTQCQNLVGSVVEACQAGNCDATVTHLVAEACTTLNNPPPCSNQAALVQTLLNVVHGDQSAESACASVGLCDVAEPQLPPLPVWPSAFSARVLRNLHGTLAVGGNWYFSEKQNAERYNFQYRNFRDEETYEAVFALYSESKAYLLKTTGNSIECKYYDLETNKVVVPSFKGYTYKGQEKLLLDYQVEVDHWYDASQKEGVINYYDLASNNTIPVRIEKLSPGQKRTEIFTFLTIDVGAQDPNLFNLPANVKATCTKAQ